MDKPKITAKDFFLWAGAMVAFYWSVIAYTLLVFEYINYAFPNALQYYPSDPYQSGISHYMASIIVLLPVYLLLMQVIRKDIASDPSRSDIWVRRWAIILTLFVAGVTMTIDLITLLTTFLNGEALTTAFILKVLTVFFVSGAVFLHFMSDLCGYWERNPGQRRMLVIGVAVLALVTIIAGFFIVGSPRDARLARYDSQKVNDLQNIDGQVKYYWQATQKLPASLTELNASLPYPVQITDPETGEPYDYVVSGALSYKLCADFNGEGGLNRQMYPERTMPSVAGKPYVFDTWEHEAGTTCFDRTIDPSFYPPIK
jgi:hypothetical protein